MDSSDPADIQHLKDLYDACIRFTDAQIHKFLKEIELLGLDDESVVVFLSDHGEEFQEHQGFWHNNIYQEILRVPLVIRFPRKDTAAPRGHRVRSSMILLEIQASSLTSPQHIQILCDACEQTSLEFSGFLSD